MSARRLKSPAARAQLPQVVLLVVPGRDGRGGATDVEVGVEDDRADRVEAARDRAARDPGPAADDSVPATWHRAPLERAVRRDPLRSPLGSAYRRSDAGGVGVAARRGLAVGGEVPDVLQVGALAVAGAQVEGHDLLG